MKKFLALLLAFLMLFILCACGTDSDRDDRDDDEDDGEKDEMTFDPDAGSASDDDDETDETETDGELETTADTEVDTEAGTEEIPAVGTVAPDTEDDPAEGASVLGATDGGHYENVYFGVAYDFGAEWYVATDAELADLIGITADAIGDAAFEQALEESGFAYSVYATADEGLTTLSVGVENLGILYGLTLTEEEYIDMSEGMLVEALESVGLTNVTTEKVTMTLAGAEHPAVKVYGQIYEIDFFETIVVIKSGNYIACVTAGSYVEDVTDEILGGFYTP